MAAMLLFCGVLLSGFIQNSTWHPCIVPIYLFTALFVRVHVVHPYISTDTATLSNNIHMRIFSVTVDGR